MYEIVLSMLDSCRALPLTAGVRIESLVKYVRPLIVMGRRYLYKLLQNSDFTPPISCFVMTIRSLWLCAISAVVLLLQVKKYAASNILSRSGLYPRSDKVVDIVKGPNKHPDLLVNDTFSLDCHYSHAQSVLSRDIEVKWFKKVNEVKEVDINQMSRYQIKEKELSSRVNHSLEILNAQKEDNGRWYCEIFINNTSVVKSREVIVHVADYGVAIDPKHQSVPLGESFVLECGIFFPPEKLVPSFSIHWYRNGILISDDLQSYPRYSWQDPFWNNSRNGALVVTNAQIEDSTEWHCELETGSQTFKKSDIAVITVDVCLLYPCLHGTCNVIEGANYSCTCEDRYTGENCTIGLW